MLGCVVTPQRRSKRSGNAVEGGIVHMQSEVQSLAQRVNRYLAVVDGLRLVAAEIVGGGLHLVQRLLHVMNGSDDAWMRRFFGLDGRRRRRRGRSRECAERDAERDRRTETMNTQSHSCRIIPAHPPRQWGMNHT